MEILYSLRWYVEFVLQSRTRSLYSDSSVLYLEEVEEKDVDLGIGARVRENG